MEESDSAPVELALEVGVGLLIVNETLAAEEVMPREGKVRAERKRERVNASAWLPPTHLLPKEHVVFTAINRDIE